MLFWLCAFCVAGKGLGWGLVFGPPVSLPTPTQVVSGVSPAGVTLPLVSNLIWCLLGLVGGVEGWVG